MSRRPARFTQADVFRAVKAMGPNMAVEIAPDGTIKIVDAPAVEIKAAYEAVPPSSFAPMTAEEWGMGWIYFIKAEISGRIKIGFSIDPEKRLAALRTGSPEPLSLLGEIRGKISDERAMHKRFSHIRVTREWFEGTPELLAFIRQTLPDIFEL